MESKLQSEIISWLKINQVYVVKTKPGPGTPVGCPDIIGLYRSRWLVIEVKASSTAPFQPGQKQTLQRFKESNEFVYVAYPEIWPEVKAELINSFLAE